MSEIQIFKNEQFGEIRTIEENGKVMFCGKDVTKALGYANTCSALAAHCKHVTKRYIPHPQNSDKQIEMSFIPEDDVCRLIIRSKLPNAAQFEKWVFNEAIPSIRRNRAYFVEEMSSELDLVNLILKAIKEERKKNKELTTIIAIQNQQIAEMKPKVSYYDFVLNCHDLLPITDIAKDYGKTAKWLNKILCEQKIQFKQNGMWLLYQKYAEKGYTQSKTITYKDDGDNHTKLYTYWTPKGRLFIYDTLKSLGHLPIIEQE